MDYRVDLLNQRAAFKFELPHLAGEELTKHLHLKGNTAISQGNK
jgi:hypothetical protein